mgnify:CR=1 FL=1
MINKSISVSEKVNIKLPNLFDKLLFTWMIPHADDFGRLPGSPAKIKALVVPMLDVTLKEVEQAIQNMHNAELIIWYSIDSEKYIQIRNFENHQSGLHKRTKSKFPEPPEHSGKFPEIPPEGKGREQNRTELKGIEGNGIEVNPPPPPSDSDKNSIDQWIKKYSIKVHGIGQLENIYSFIGTMDMECIHYALKESEGKEGPYPVKIMQRLLKEGKTTKESISIIPAANVTRLNRATEKPKMPVYKPQTPKITDEQYEEILRKAREWDRNKEAASQ